MGINLVIGCPRHRERMWIFRNHEAAGLARFFREHKHCGEKVISHDQSSDDVWATTDAWQEQTFPAEDGQ